MLRHGSVGLRARLRIHRHRRKITALKKSQQRVVVALGDRIELVIVAARTFETDAHQRAPHELHALIEFVHQNKSLNANVLECALSVQRNRGRQRLIDRVVSAVERFHLVSGEVDAREPVPRSIFVETLGDPRRITRCIQRRSAVRLTVCAVARVIQPVPRPPPAEVR